MDGETQERPYPYVQVMMCFALLGGAAGGAVLAVLTAIGAFLLSGDMSALGGVLLVFMFAMAGTLQGLLPAAVCGICLAVRRTDGSRSGLIHAAVYGALLSLGTQSGLMGQFHSSFVYGSLLALLTGAVTAWLLALFVLPLPSRVNPEYSHSK